MKKHYLKSALMAVAGVGLLANAALAAPLAMGPWVDYEYYQKTTPDGVTGYPGQFLEDGDTVNFFFDLAFLGLGDPENYLPGGTDSQLSFISESDVSGYGLLYGTKPVESIWTAITLFSVDAEWEQFSVDVTAFVGVDQTYQLTDQAFTLGQNDDTATIIIKWSGDLLNAWKLDPYGVVHLELTTFVDPTFAGFNDFNLLEVGTGVTPVPEPTTMLLFGTGLVGLAGLARRKKS